MDWKQVYEEDTLKGAIYQTRQAVVRNWVDGLGFRAGERILEVGCGAGLTTVALARRGYVVEAMDLADAMLQLTRKAADAAGVGHLVKTSIGDVHRLCFPSHAFAAVLAIGVVPWLHSPQTAIAEMARVLKPQGQLLVTADNRWRLNHVLDPSLSPLPATARRGVQALLCRFVRQQPRPVQQLPRLDSIPEFDGWLSTAGLTKVKGRTVGFGPFTYRGQQFLRETTAMRLQDRLQKLADLNLPGIRMSGAHYIVLARK
jgi:ubiquinone/menaquinone biosynthesis C-methylase UbiE